MTRKETATRRLSREGEEKASGRFFKKKLRKKFLLLVPLAYPRHAGLGPASTTSRFFAEAAFAKPFLQKCDRFLFLYR